MIRIWNQGKRLRYLCFKHLFTVLIIKFSKLSILSAISSLILLRLTILHWIYPEMMISRILSLWIGRSRRENRENKFSMNVTMTSFDSLKFSFQNFCIFTDVQLYL